MNCPHTDCPAGGPCRYAQAPPTVVPAAGVTHSLDYRSALTPAHPSVIQAQRDAWKAECEAARRTADVDELQRRLTTADEQSARRLDALEAAECAVDAALAAGAVQFAAAREALRDIAESLSDHATAGPSNEHAAWLRATSALAATEGDGDVQEWLCRFVESVTDRTDVDPNVNYGDIVGDAIYVALAAPPALPQEAAVEALGQAFAWVLDMDEPRHPEAVEMGLGLARRWLERGER